MQKNQGCLGLFVKKSAPPQLEAGQQADRTDDDQAIGLKAVEPIPKQGTPQVHLRKPPQGQPRQVAIKAPSWRPSKGPRKGPSDEIGRIQQADAMARRHQSPADSGDQPLVNGGGTLLKNEVHGSGPPGNLC